VMTDVCALNGFWAMGLSTKSRGHTYK